MVFVRDPDSAAEPRPARSSRVRLSNAVNPRGHRGRNPREYAYRTEARPDFCPIRASRRSRGPPNRVLRPCPAGTARTYRGQHLEDKARQTEVCRVRSNRMASRLQLRVPGVRTQPGAARAAVRLGAGSLGRRDPGVRDPPGEPFPQTRPAAKAVHRRRGRNAGHAAGLALARGRARRVGGRSPDRGAADQLDRPVRRAWRGTRANGERANQAAVSRIARPAGSSADDRRRRSTAAPR